MTQLKDELRDRDLSKVGKKEVLIKRLRDALIEEDEDPDEFEFDENEMKQFIKKMFDEQTAEMIEKIDKQRRPRQ